LKAAAPPVYRPQTQTALAKLAAPPVYRPQPQATQAKMAAPPVYRPQPQTTQLRPAPPVYRPQPQATQAKMAGPAVYRPQPQTTQLRLAAPSAYQPDPRRAHVNGSGNPQPGVNRSFAPGHPTTVQAMEESSDGLTNLMRPMAFRAPKYKKQIKIVDELDKLHDARSQDVKELERVREEETVAERKRHARKLAKIENQIREADSEQLESLQRARERELERHDARDRQVYLDHPDLKAKQKGNWPVRSLLLPDDICLGGIELPKELSEKPSELMKSVRLERVPDPAVTDGFDAIRKNEGLKKKVIANTISTMYKAGQIAYLRDRGLTSGDWKIWVEIHYIRSRPKNQLIFHKDTKGQTLFVNLSYVTDHQIAGPEFIFNPRPVKAHDQQTKKLLPKSFRDDVRQVRSLDQGTEIEAITVPAHGVVVFVDELIHHTTPHYGPRTVSGKQVADFLEKRFPNESQAHRSFHFPLIEKKPATTFTKDTWKRLMAMRGSPKRFDRDQLTVAGLSNKLVNQLFDEVYPGFRVVSVPNAAGGNAFRQKLPRLTRQMSSKDLRENLPPEVTGERRFFRTWVRAVKRTVE